MTTTLPERWPLKRKAREYDRNADELERQAAALRRAAKELRGETTPDLMGTLGRKARR